MKRGKEEEYSGHQIKRVRHSKAVHPESSGKKSGWIRLREALAREGLDGLKKDISFLSDEDSHKVWKPKFTLADVVAQNMKTQPGSGDKFSQSVNLPMEREKSEKERSLSAKSLQAERHRRKNTLMKRVNFAWKVLQENPPEQHQPELRGKERWKAVAKKVSGAQKQTDFSQIIAELVAKEKAARAN